MRPAFAPALLAPQDATPVGARPVRSLAVLLARLTVIERRRSLGVECLPAREISVSTTADTVSRRHSLT